MNKIKLFITALFLAASLSTLASAEQFRIPKGDGGDLKTSEFGGNKSVVIQNSATEVYVSTGAGAVQAVYCSSVPSTATPSTEFVTFFSSDSLVGIVDASPTKFLRVGFSPSSATYTGMNPGFVVFRPAVSYRKGLVAKFGSALMPMCTIVYTKYD